MSAKARDLDPTTVDYQHGRLAVAMPLSEHYLISWNRLARAAKKVLGGCVLIFLALSSVALVIDMLKKNQTPAAVFGGFITLSLSAWGFRVISSALNLYSQA